MAPVKQENELLLREQQALLRSDSVGTDSIRMFANFGKVQVGDEVQLEKTITGDDVQQFARLSGDCNPLHMDENFSQRTHFGRRVVHGMLLASYVSTLVGVHCPGPGALWNRQTYRWTAPVFIGDHICLRLRVTHKSVGARVLTIDVLATNQTGKVVMEGEGAVTVIEELKRTPETAASEKIALVTEASHGIGAAIALALAEAGAAVIVHHQAESSAAQDLCAAIESKGGRAIPLQTHTLDGDSAAAAVQTANAMFARPVNILINNAVNLSVPRPFTQTKWDDVQSTLDAHLRSAFHCCQAVIPGMAAQNSGRIINIGSAFARNVPPANWSTFLMAKSALQALTRSLAVELGPQGIRVNMVSPGLIDTEAAGGLSDRLRKVQAMQTPLRRLASMSEISAVVCALCFTAGDFVSGVEIPVCGGLHV